MASNFEATEAIISGDDGDGSNAAIPDKQPTNEVLIPKNCMQLEDEIPTQNLLNLYQQSEIEVTVAHIYSPSHMWLQQIGVQQRQLGLFKIEMREHFDTHGRVRTDFISYKAIKVGLYCCGFYEADYHRYKIVKILNFTNVKVLLVDCGKVVCVPITNLRPLLSKWGELPQQAIRAKLSGIKPRFNKKTWNIEMVEVLYNLWRNKPLRANLIDLNEITGVFRVVLLYTGPTGKHTYINWQLVNLGKADNDSKCALNQRSYERPDFYLLENGMTLTSEEMADLKGRYSDLEDMSCYETFGNQVNLMNPSEVPSGIYPPLVGISKENIDKFWKLFAIDNEASNLFLKYIVAATLSNIDDKRSSC